jgi:hypothetical protein
MDMDMDMDMDMACCVRDTYAPARFGELPLLSVPDRILSKLLSILINTQETNRRAPHQGKLKAETSSPWLPTDGNIQKPKSRNILTVAALRWKHPETQNPNIPNIPIPTQHRRAFTAAE